jgi:chromosome segregation ATPase
MYDTYQRIVGESVFYGHQIYSYRVKEMENTSQALKEARAMIATLKKGRRKDKAKIQELSEVIHEQNFLLQHNDQYMLELENQLEAIAAPPPEPVIPGPEGGEDAEEIQGESGVESGPASP